VVKIVFYLKARKGLRKARKVIKLFFLFNIYLSFVSFVVKKKLTAKELISESAAIYFDVESSLYKSPLKH
jgi:hypothetical protein